MKDLIILVADKNMEYTLRGLLSRPKALGIRSNLTWEIVVHPKRDPGCFRKAHEFLKPHRSFFPMHWLCLIEKDVVRRIYQYKS